MNTIFYSFTVFIILFVLVFFLVYLLQKFSKTQLQQIFAVNLILVIIPFVFMFSQMFFGNILKISPIYYEFFSYIGLAYLPVSMYFTTSIFINTKVKFKVYHLFYFVVPTLCLIMLWTNNFHHLFFKQYSIFIKYCEFGLFYIIFEAYSYFLYALSIIKLFYYFWSNSGIYAKQGRIIIYGTVIPLAIKLLGIIGLIDFTVYITPISLAIAILFYTFTLFKYQLLSTLPISLAKIVNRISDGFIVLNDKNIVTDYNATFLSMFNIENEDLQMRHIFSIIEKKEFDALDEETIIKALQSVVNSNETLIFELQFETIKKYLRIEINSVKSEDSFIGALILFKDLTQHYKDLKTIKTNQSMLVEKERLASLGQMISGIAHNLKTPIFSISGATEGLHDLVTEYKESIPDQTVTVEDHLAIAKDMDDWISKIKNYTEYMSDVITAVRGQAVAFVDKPDETFTVEELTKHVSVLMKHELQQSLTKLNINVDLEDNLQLKGNINSLVQVINNLISNAIQAYNGKTNNEIEFDIYKQDNNVIFSVKDYGCGMSDNTKDKLFKEMITTKGKNGTGLGLFMSASNIKAQFNGEIKFDSEEGKGTTFYVIIPIK